MEDVLKYGIELAAAAVAAVVAIKVAVARMDERLTSLRNEIADLEAEHNKIEAKLDRVLEMQQQTSIQIARITALMERSPNA